MENVVKMSNRGVLPHEPADADELLPIKQIDTEVTVDKPRELPAVLSVETDADKPREHVRAPELRRHGSKLLMTAAAAVGAAAGVRLIFGEETEALMNSISQTLAGSFGAVFLRQAFLGVIFLGVEFVLGFFAFGDLIVWGAPFLCAAGTVLRLAASSPKLLPGAIVCLGGVVFGAAYSADMSELLLRLTRGGTVYMEARPRRSYAMGFLGCLAAIVLGAILVAILATV